MSAEDVAAVRRKIGDSVKSGRDTLTGNGTDRIIDLTGTNVWSVVVGYDGVDIDVGLYTVDAAPGRISFTTPPPEGTAVTINYLYAAYTDTEVQSLIDERGSIAGAVVEAIQELLINTARFYDFTQGETSEKRSQVFNNLNKLLETYQAQQDKEDAAAKRGSGLKIGKRTVGRADRRTRYPIDYSPSRRW